MIWLLLFLACKTVEDQEPDPHPGMEVVGELGYLCRGTDVRPADGLEVVLRAGAAVLGKTTTDVAGTFRIETAGMVQEEGSFLLTAAEAAVKISGSTRLRYRVFVRLPCDDEDEQVGPQRVVSEVWPEERS